MNQENTFQKFSKDIESLVRTRLGSALERYGYNLDMVFTANKWKPLVLIIGNYSSGKSTFINELLSTEIQRTGQAPTDDSFTVITATEGEEVEATVPGSTIINDPSLPFELLRKFGEKLISHFQLKRISNESIQGIAIIDTPGMLDSVTEKDRGYDYLGVIGEIAKISDLIILMFDPHKAGTIKETYEAIRSTLPGTAGEDRIIYVLNRIDECENVSDLVKSYGTLSWNLSQMTGRKDMPRIFLTFSPERTDHPEGFEIWTKERDELKASVFSAPRMRLNHILQLVDRELRGFALLLEAMSTFRKNFWQRMKNIAKNSLFAALIAFFFGDLLLKFISGYPVAPLLSSLVTGDVPITTFLIPSAFALLTLGLTSVYVQRIFFPKYRKATLSNLDSLVVLDTAYKRDLWQRIRKKVEEIISKQSRKQIWLNHSKNLAKTNRIIEKDLIDFYNRIKSL